MATVEMTKGGKTAYINSTAEDLARATADGWRRVDGDGGKSESDVIKLAAMGSLNGFTVSVVDALPSEGQAGVMYFIPDSDEGYVYLADSKRYEKLVFNNGGGAGASGGTSTSNYNDLANKPKIAGVTLEGNKTAEDLSLATSDDLATETAQRTDTDSALDTRITTLENAPAIDAYTKAQANTLLDGKADATHSHTQAQITGLETALNAKVNATDLARVATSGNYSDLNGASPYQLPQGTQGDTIAFYNGSWVKASFSGMNFSYDNQHSKGSFGILLGNSNKWGIVKLDAALSDTSTAAIQNKAVTEALNTKADSALLQAEQDARTGTDDSLLSLINALQSLVSTLETRIAALETKVQ